MKSKKGNRWTIEVSNATASGVCRWIQKRPIPFRSHSTRRRTVGYKELLKIPLIEKDRFISTSRNRPVCWRWFVCVRNSATLFVGASVAWDPRPWNLVRMIDAPLRRNLLAPHASTRRQSGDDALMIYGVLTLRLRPRDFVINRNKCKCPFFLKTKLITTTVPSRAEATSLSDRCVSIMRGGHFPVRFGVEVEVMTAFGGEMRASQTFDWTRLRKFIIMFEVRVRMIFF